MNIGSTIRNRCSSTILACCMVLAGTAGQVLAQVSPPTGTLSAFPLNPLPVSARCAGLGLACNAMADDLDMITANPSGLAWNAGWSVSLNARYAWMETVHLEQEALNSPYLGARDSQVNKLINDDTVDLSFLGVSRQFGDWSLSLFYQNDLSFDGGLSVEQIFQETPSRLLTNSYRFSTHLEHLGASVALRMTDRWSMGVSLLHSQLDIESVDIWQAEASDSASIPGTQFPFIQSGNVVDDSETDTTFHTGLTWRATDRLTMALAYRQGGDFNLSSRGVWVVGRPSNLSDQSLELSENVSIPDILSLGASWNWRGSTTFSAEIAYISHADLPPQRDRTLALNLVASELIEPIDDTVAISLAVEHEMRWGASARLFALRLGVTTESDHDGIVLVDGDDYRFSGGLGFYFGSTDRFRADLGVLGGDEEIVSIFALAYTAGTN